jgi:hypothetical protein
LKPRRSACKTSSGSSAGSELSIAIAKFMLVPNFLRPVKGAGRPWRTNACPSPQTPSRENPSLRYPIYTHVGNSSMSYSQVSVDTCLCVSLCL